MEARKATVQDIPGILSLFEQAREYFRMNGIDQWQDGYPDEEALDEDLKAGCGWTFYNEGKLCAYAAIIDAEDENYREMVSGQWISDRPYFVIHRIAVSNDCKGQGLAGQIFRFGSELYPQFDSVRIDTHEDNKSMRHCLEKNGFEYCGVIRLQRDGALRVAYEKNLGNRTGKTDC